MKIHLCKQYDADWWMLRRGKITASNAKRILTAKTAKSSAAANDYILELIADLHCQTPNFFTDRPRSRDMEHGTNCEPEARRWYAVYRSVEVLEVGGIETDDNRLWASPDGLVDPDGLIEIKCPARKTHVSYMLDQDKLLMQYRAQCHFQLIVSERKWVDLVSYVTGFDPIIIRIEPDGYTELLRNAIEVFYSSYQATIRRLQRGPSKPAAPAALPTLEEPNNEYPGPPHPLGD